MGEVLPGQPSEAADEKKRRKPSNSGAKGKGKGSEFERAFCKQLSQWWSRGTRDDLFWRSSMSGGRAVMRTRRGQKTPGQYGDVSAIDAWGAPLISLCVIELKCGYGPVSVGDYLDTRGTTTPQWKTWVDQVVREQEASGKPYWWLVTKRDMRLPVLYMPYRFWYDLGKAQVVKCVMVRGAGVCTVMGIPLPTFFEVVEPANIEDLYKRITKGGVLNGD